MVTGMNTVRFFQVACLLLVLAGCGGDDDENGNAAGDGSDPFGNANPDVPIVTTPDGGGLLDMCGAEPFVATETKVNLLLVIDKSASMLDTPQGFDADKWISMKRSLGTALASVQGSLSLGLLLYPSEGCDVPADVAVDIAEGAQALPDVDAALDDAAPAGGTPTAKALQRALAYFQSGGGANLPGDKYVLLATDGGPNCNPDLGCEATECTSNIDGICPPGIANCCDPAVGGSGDACLDDTGTASAIEALYDAQVPTFVVGIPGTEQYAGTLDSLANAGGRPNPDAPPRYYAVTAQGDEPGGLTDVLSNIAASLIRSCRLQLGETPPSLDKLNVRVDGKLVPQTADDGWAIDVGTDPPTIELLGETCDRVEQRGAESVEVLFGCPTILG
jgi:hypothetical protein